ncbi:MAG: MFS transporter [Actinobacteria bacterium]|nr:MFS transporter [Actinomycetota bacterium]
MLPSGKRGGALGLIASSMTLGAAVGPILGGAIEQLAGWHALFYGTFFLALLLIPSALYALPNGGSDGEHHFDLTGGILLGVAAGLFLFGITQGQVAGFVSPSSWGSFAGAVIAAALFTWRIADAPHPFVSPALFKNRTYAAAVIVGSFSYLSNISMFVFVPLLVVEVNGISPVAAGLVLTPGAIAFAVLSPLTGRLSDHVGMTPPTRAFLAARKEAGSEAINLLYTLDAAPFSDAFLAIAGALIIALIAAFGLRSDGTKRAKASEQTRKELVQ